MKNANVTVNKNNEVANKQIKGDVVQMENRAYLKENGYLYTTRDILAALSKAEGFKSRGSKNMAAVMNAIAEGNSILKVLGNPVEYGIEKNQVHYVEDFVKTHKLSNRIYPATRKGVLAASANVHRLELRDGKAFSNIDYTEVNSESYVEVSESYLSDQLSQAEELITFSTGGEMYKERILSNMSTVFFVDLNLPVVEDLSELDEEERIKYELRDKAIEEGFYFTDENGEVGHAMFLLWTPAQNRVLKAMFVDTRTIEPIFGLKKIGTEIPAYAKYKDGVYTVDITKMMSRPGLAGTNSQVIDTIRIGSEVVKQGNDYALHGGNFNMLVTEDRMVEIKTGRYRMWNEETHEFGEFDAAEHPVTITAGDGMLFFSPRVAKFVESYTGEFFNAGQVRITPFSKGLGVVVDTLESYYPGYDIVALQSAVKGDYTELFKFNPDYKIEFRLALANKNINRTKIITNLPYQGVHASQIGMDTLGPIFNETLKDVGLAMKDAEVMKKYVGLEKVVNDDLFSDELEDFMTTRSRNSLLTTFLDMFPWAYEDPGLKKYALDILIEKLEDYKTGNVPVKGHYRYMVQDPYAILEAGTLFETRNEKGELMIEKRAHHIQPNHVVLDVRKGEELPDEVSLVRNPTSTEGAVQTLTVEKNKKMYKTPLKNGYFSNMVIMSVHDFCAQAMDGADFDGDTALVILEKAIVEAFKKSTVAPILDGTFKVVDGKPVKTGDGNPYALKPSGVYQLPKDMLVSQDGYTVQFTAEQYTDDFYREVYKLMLDFVKRSMQPNEVGIITNISTIIQDGIRNLLASDVNPVYRENRISQFQEWVDLLGVIQGWEIDKPKQGGAFWEVLSKDLDFMNNPPEELGYVNKKTGRAVWNKPAWLAARKGKEGIVNNSIFSKIRQGVQEYEENVLKGYFNQEMEKAEDNTLFTKLNSVFQLESNYFMMLTKLVGRIKANYGTAIRAVFNHEENQKQQAINRSLDGDFLDMLFEDYEKERRTMISEISESAREEINELCQKYPAKDIGYVAYYITYADRKKNSSLSFPWAIATDAFIQTLAYVENADKQKQVGSNQVIDYNFSLAVCIPDAVQEEFTMETVIKGLSKGSVSVMAQGDKYKLFINKTEVGFVYNSRKNIAPLLGHDKFVLRVNTITLGNGSRTLNLEVDKLIKVGA